MWTRSCRHASAASTTPACVVPQVTAALGNQAQVVVLRKRAADATAAMAKGQTIDAAAAAAGGHIVHHQPGLQRAERPAG